MSSIYKLTKFIITIVAAFVIWYVSNCDSPSSPPKDLLFPFNRGGVWDDIYQGIYPYKMWVVLVAIILQSVLIVKPSFSKYKKERRLLETVMNDIIVEEFGDSLTHVRGTIYRKRFGLLFIPTYFWKTFVANFSPHFRKGLLFHYIRNFPNPFRYYLVFFSRRGHPHEGTSSTNFLVPKSSHEINGYVSYVWLENRTCSVDLPIITAEDILKANDIKDIKRNKRKVVEDYMEKGKIKNFSLLKSIHRFSSWLWATPLYDKSQKPWGVLIFDIDPAARITPNSELENKLLRITKHIGAIIQVFF